MQAQTRTFPGLQEPLKEVTIDFVLGLRPCYSREQLEKIADGKTSMTLLEVCDLDVPAGDLLWFFLQKDVLPDRVLHSLACDFAEHVLQARREQGKEPDPRSWAATETKRRWLLGEASDEEVEQARRDAAAADDDAAAAAAAAAYAAYAYAAYAAYAADAAADAAAAAAAAYAAYAYAAYAADAADAAAAAAERNWQLQRVREVIASAG